VPTASVAGKVRFDRVYTVNSATLKPLRDRTLVVQGMTVKGTYDQTVPVACGEISS
jgi:hypothetical protein